MNRHLYENLPKPAIFAHRGSSAYAPENTLRAFSLAIEQKADGIELDVWLTKDDHVVVIHDQNTYRTTGINEIVSNLSLSDVKKMDAGSHFGKNYHNEKIPTLGEVFDLVRRQVIINIELKDYYSANGKLAAKVTQVIKDFEAQYYVMFSSFNPVSLLYARKYLPNIPTALLALRDRGGWLARSLLINVFRFQALHPNFLDVDRRLVEQTHEKHRRIHPYTIDDIDFIKQMVCLEVDGIITNNPVVARNSLFPNLPSNQL